VEHRFRNGFWNKESCEKALFREGRRKCTEKERLWNTLVRIPKWVVFEIGQRASMGKIYCTLTKGLLKLNKHVF
jgi:hypothetical protein